MDHVKELRLLMERDPDIGNMEKAKPFPVERLVELLLRREKELAAPDPPHGSIQYYFGRPDSSREAKEALYEALPELLRSWIQMKETT